jgi:uncharacterized delta-60 repeat protein
MVSLLALLWLGCASPLDLDTKAVTDKAVGACDLAAWYTDDDGDLRGDGLDVVWSTACKLPGRTLVRGDCDDTDAAVNRGAKEICDGIDNDCDGLVDSDDAPLFGGLSLNYHPDLDSDGFGDPTTTRRACSQPVGHVADDSDCDDSDSAVSPAATEICDGTDNDCNGWTDSDDPGLDGGSTWTIDHDDDGYGELGSVYSVIGCEAPSGYSGDATDCDDLDSGVNPGATDVCGDGVDADCDGSGGPDSDEDGDGLTWIEEDALGLDDCTVDTAPEITDIALSATEVFTDDDLSVTVTASDADGDSVVLTYAWDVDGTTVLSGVDEHTLSGATDFDRDAAVSVTVTPSDGVLEGAASTSDTLVVQNSPPGAPVAAVSPAEPDTDDDLLCEVAEDSTDADGDSVAYGMSWTVDGLDFDTGTADTGTADTGTADTGTADTGGTWATWPGDTVSAADTLDGEEWICTVTPSDDANSGTTASDAVTVTQGCPTGELDTAFGTGGVAMVDLGSTDSLHGLTVQDDDAIVIVGSSGIGEFEVLRITAAGALDSSFGSGGVTTTAFTVSASSNAVLIQPDGRIVVSGTLHSSCSTDWNRFALARYETDGTLDATFGSGGTETTNWGTVGASNNNVVLQSDGSIVLVGGHYDSSNCSSGITHTSVARYTSAGVLDSSFGSAGEYYFDVPYGPHHDYGEGVAIGSDDSIYFNAMDYYGSQTSVYKLDADGALDSSFGGGGEVLVSTDQGVSVVIDPDGQLLVSSTVALGRMDTDGTWDSSFGSGGLASVSAELADGIVVDADGHVLVPDRSLSGLAVVRYDADGTLDTGFGSGGTLVIDEGEGTIRTTHLAEQSDGGLLIAGTYDGDLAVARVCP